MYVDRVVMLHVLGMKDTLYYFVFFTCLTQELGRLIEDSKKGRSNIIDTDIIQEWMTNKRVLSLALEGILFTASVHLIDVL